MMLTEWGERLNAQNPLPEYPRPQIRRENWLCLNGPWEYAISGGLVEPAGYDGTIIVPFSPEAALSGVNRRLEPGQSLWYRRRFTLPVMGLGGGRALLHFGAVDQTARVWVNGHEVARHTGGYLPFTADITEALAIDGDNLLCVLVQDECDASFHSRGKQVERPGGIWYTSQSGIWQTVWLECVPRVYIQRLVITPHFGQETVELTVQTNGDLDCELWLDGQVTTFRSNTPCMIQVPSFEPWSPENPKLYDFTVRMGKDCVESYFAMRQFGVGPDGNGIPRLMLNGQPYFHTGVLDQGYWPDGLYTPPSDEAMIWDIRLMKDMGFNMLRKHIKVEPLRWYYHCDRLGMLVWQDMVNGGVRYNKRHITLPLIFGNSHRDSDYAYFGRADVRGREEYTRELEETVRHLYNCPCVAVWTPFNEGWGQFDAARAAAAIRTLDPGRAIDHASGWHDQGAGDFKSSHVYFRPYHFRADKRGRVVALTEFGGYAYREEGHCWSEKTFGYKALPSREALARAFVKLYERQIIPSKAKGLAAAIYTQLSDVEEEINGFVSYDRRVVKIDTALVASLNERLRTSAEEAHPVIESPSKDDDPVALSG